MKPRFLSVARLSFPLASAIAALIAAQSTQADTIYWDGTSASWNTAANWSTASGATTPNPTAVPGALDDVIFNITTVNGAETITMGANQAANSLTFNNTGTTELIGGGTARTLSLGAGGITMAATAGAVTLGSGVATNNVLLNLSGAQTWTNNSASAFTINNTAATFTRQTGATLTFNKLGAGNFAVTSGVSNTNSIIGPWAFFGTGSSQRYATITAGNVAGFTGTTAANVNSLGSATTNYELTTGGTNGTVGGRTANTIRYAGAATSLALYNGGQTQSYDLTLNGILAVGTGTFQITRSSPGTADAGLIVGATGELVVAGSQAVTISAPIQEGSAGSRLTYSGSNTLTLSGVNTYTGSTTVSSGILSLNNSLALQNSPLNTAGSIAGNATNGLKTNQTTLTLGGLTGDKNFAATGGVFTTTSGGYGSVTALTLNPGTGATHSYSGVIANGAAAMTLTKTGAGTQTLSGANTYTGATTISAGNLSINSIKSVGGVANALGQPLLANATIDIGATTVAGRLTYTGAGDTTDRVLNLAGTTGGATIDQSGASGLLKFSSPLTATGVGAKTLTLQGSTAGTGEIGGAIVNSSGGATALTKLGTGTWTLSGNNTYTGTTTVSGGVLVSTGTSDNGVGTTTLAGGASTKGMLYVPSGSYSSTSFLVGSSNAGSIGSMVVAGGSLTATTAATNAGIILGNGTSDYGGLFLSSGSVTSNRIDLGNAGNITSTGVLQVTGGILTSTEYILARSPKFEFTVTGGSVIHNAASQNIALGFNNSGRGTMTVAGGTVDNTGRNITILQSAGTPNVSINLNGGNTITNSILKTLAGGTGVLNFNGGTLTAGTTGGTLVSGANGLTAYVNGAFGSFSGGAVIDTAGLATNTISADLLAPTGNGVSGLSVGSAGSGYIGAPVVEIDGDGTGATGYAVVDLNPSSGTFGQVTSVVLTNPGIGYTTTPTVTLSGGGGSGAGITASGVTANTSGGLTKQGLGSLTLSGTNTYSGATTISAGTLVVNGSISNSTVGLNSGALTGSGSVNAVNVANAVGNVISNNNGVTGDDLTIGALTFNGAATVNTFSNSTSAAIVTTALATNVAGTVTINPTAASWTVGTPYDLISYTGTYAGGGLGQFSLGTVIGITARQSKTLANSGMAITLTVGADDSPVWSGVGTQTWSTATTGDHTGPNAWALLAGQTATNFWAGDTVQFNDTYNLGAGNVAVSNTTVNITGGVAPLSTTFNNSLVNYTINSSDSTGISAGSVTKNGTGSVTISTANTYTGATAINAGTILISGSGTLGTGSALTLGGGSLDLGTTSQTVGAVSVTAAAASGDTISNGSLTGTSYAASNSTGNAIISANLLPNGSAGFAKTGGGSVTLSGLSATAASNYSGTTTIDQGTLAFTTTSPSLTGGLTFGASAGSTNTGSLDLTNASATFGGGLIVRSDSTSNNVINIGSGQTLTLTGSTVTNAISVGSATAGGVAKLQVTGSTGTFTVNDATRNIVVANTDTTGTGASAEMDLSGLGTFNATIENLYVGRPTSSAGAAANGRPLDTLTLAGANTITASGYIAVGGTSHAFAGQGQATMNLGTTNVLYAASFVVGSSRTSGTMQFNTGLTNPSATLRGTAGGATRTDIYLGDQGGIQGVASAGGSTAISGTMDFTGGSVDAMIGSLIVGSSNTQTAGNRGRGNGTFIIDGASSNVDVNTLEIARNRNDNSAGSNTSTSAFTMINGTLVVNTAATLANDIDTSDTATGIQGLSATFNLQGGTATIGSLVTPVNLTLGNKIASGNAGALTANVNLTGGTLNMFGDIKEGTQGNGTIDSTLTLNGATLDMKGNSIGTSGALIDNLNFQSGTLRNAAQINDGAGITKTTNGTLILDGTNTYAGTTDVTAGTLLINGSTSTGLMSVGAAGTLGGIGTVGGATTVNGILSPGQGPGGSPGTMTFQDTLGLGGSTIMEIDGNMGAGVTGGHDFVNQTGAGVLGALTYGGTMTLDIGTVFGDGIYSWNLFDFASESSTFTGITLADQYSGTLTDSGGGVWGFTDSVNTWTFTESDGILGLTVVVPEPGVTLLGALGAMLLLRRRR